MLLFIMLMKNPARIDIITMATMAISINIMLQSIYIANMIMKKINNKFYKILGITLLIFVSGCQISPGIYLEPQSSWVDKKEYVYIPALEENIFIKDISSNLGFDNWHW